MASFNGKVVIITGASSGIGAGTAVEYAKRGAKVVLGGRNEERLQKTGQLCSEQGISSDDILLVSGDLTNEDVCNRIVDRAVEKFGCIDILVNNAGSVLTGHIDTCTVADMDAMYNTNFRSVFMMTKRAIPHLEKTKGVIVNISSIAGNKPLPYVTAYGVAKAAVIHFTQTLAQDVAARGIRVNCITPGTIVTDIFTRPGGHIADDPDKLEQFYEKMGKVHPMQRVGEVSEVASTIMYLTSEASSFVTGAVIPVDGGRHGTCTQFHA